MLRVRGLVAVLVVCGAIPGASRGQVAPADPGKVADAVARAAAFLKTFAGPGYTGGQHGIGAASLVGLALLEAGTPPTDPSLETITNLVRSKAATETATYNVSLALLYLDRLRDSRDLPAIQHLGLKLYAGMLASGGYNYQCPALPIAPAAVRPRPAPKKEGRTPEADGFLPLPGESRKKDPAEPTGTLTPENAAIYLALRQQLRAGGRIYGDGDNSNTQFGLIALWVAGRHGVPADDAFALLETRFLTSQNRSDGGWGYNSNGNSTPSMTCAGLLGVAVGASRKPPAPKVAQVPEGVDPNDPFFTPPDAKDGAKIDLAGPRQRATTAGLTYIGRMLKAVPAAGMNQFNGLGDEYYTLWSVERVAMAFGLDTIGDVDWHALGCSVLLPKQASDGSWPGGHAGTEISTSFAILFLVRSNFVTDLTARLQGKIKDPGKGELRGGLGLTPPPRPDDPAGPGLGESVPGETTAAPDAAELADDLLNSANFPEKLREVRNAKGTVNTAALLIAIPKLSGEKQVQARTTLEERLTRMTAKTLAAQLADDNAVLRRAAAVACGTKQDKGTVGALIDRMTDPVDAVTQAARLSLKTMTQQDFGPSADAGPEAKARAKEQWSKWYLTSGLAGGG